MMKAMTTAAVLALAASAQAQLVISGAIEESDPAYNRAFEDFSGLSGIGSNVFFDVYEIGVTGNGSYTFLAEWAGFDGFLFLYDEFNPAAPRDNGIEGNDDFGSLFVSSFEASLTAGETYFIVATTFESGDTGDYTVTVRSGDGSAFLVPAPGAFAAFAAAGLAATRRRR